MSRQLTEANIIFPSSQHNINSIISELKRSNLSISNRLRSIAQDATFVDRVAAELQLPLIANERCGSWYIDPDEKAGSAYFKSTDGHFGQWSFSLRRLNLHLLKLIKDGQGCIIVDSTRRGKSMPDALSKTVPIWICLLNRLLFPSMTALHDLKTPTDVVSASEHSQIEARLDQFLDNIRTLKLDIDELRTAVGRPMRPYWVTPDADINEVRPDTTETWPIVLCTASSKASVDVAHDSSYVQGAADDHESWAHGLTAVLFWQNKSELLATTEDDIVPTILQITQRAAESGPPRTVSLVAPTSNLFITDNSNLVLAASDMSAVVYCAPEPNTALEAAMKTARKTCIHLNCGEGKNGSRQLRTELSKLEALAQIVLSGESVLCSCPSGRDLAVGVALSLLCSFYAADGHPDSNTSISKPIIKQKLSWIVVSMPDAAPSRATLQSVNAFLMS